MKIDNIRKRGVLALCTMFLFGSCSKDDDTPEEEEIAQAKNIQWEVFYESEAGETVTQFEVSDDGQWLFYSTATGEAFRVNKSTGIREKLSARPLEFDNGKLYTYIRRDYKSYFGVSTDFGKTITEYHVGTYTNYAAGWYNGTFMNLIVNRLFVMPNGDLILPHIMDNANNAAYLQDNYLIAVSEDGGATWERKETTNSYISVCQGNRLFAIDEGWTGVNSSQLFYSDNQAASWEPSNLAYRPQAVDRDNNLIAGSRNEIQKLKGDKWMIYTWDETVEPLVSITGLRYEGLRGDDPYGRQMDDIEFDAENNMYVIGKNGTTICRTKLE